MYRSVDLNYQGDIPFIDMYTNMLIATIPDFEVFVAIAEGGYDLEIQSADSSQSIDIKEKYSHQLNEMISQNQQRDALTMLICHLIMDEDLNHIVVEKTDSALFQISPQHADNSLVELDEFKHEDMLFSEFEALKILKEVEGRRLLLIYGNNRDPLCSINKYPGYKKEKRYEARFSDLFFETGVIKDKNGPKLKP